MFDNLDFMALSPGAPSQTFAFAASLFTCRAPWRTLCCGRVPRWCTSHPRLAKRGLAKIVLVGGRVGFEKTILGRNKQFGACEDRISGCFFKMLLQVVL